MVGRPRLRRILTCLPTCGLTRSYALATTGSAPKDALEKGVESRGKVSDEGLALIGLALDASSDGRAKERAGLVEKKAKTTDSDAYWSGNYDELLDYWGEDFP